MFLTPLQRRRISGLFHKKHVVPCVCLRESEPSEARYAIREITLNADKVVINIAREALSPEASLRAQLGEVIRALIEAAKSGPVRCGETSREFTQAEMETWLVCVGEPVLKIIEG